jgi:hypothetical protein
MTAVPCRINGNLACTLPLRCDLRHTSRYNFRMINGVGILKINPTIGMYPFAVLCFLLMAFISLAFRTRSFWTGICCCHNGTAYPSAEPAVHFAIRPSALFPATLGRRCNGTSRRLRAVVIRMDERAKKSGPTGGHLRAPVEDSAQVEAKTIRRLACSRQWA